MLNAEAWIKRATEVLGDPQKAHQESVPFAVSLLSSVYGPQSIQSKTLSDQLERIASSAPNPTNARHHEVGIAQGAIRNTVAELEAGLITTLRALVAGEIFGELVFLAKQILADQTEAAKTVASVLVAVAFEDLMRRMGTELAGVMGRPEMQDVITALKNAAVFKGGEIGTAQSFLKLRNDSLHADWAKVQR
jgi:hypothetical protein